MAPGIENVILPTVNLPPSKQPLQRRQTTLHHHSQITTDSDVLQFQAAASQQLKIHDGTSSDNNAQKNLLITSPYNSPNNQLDLTTLDTANQLLAKALTIFTPVRPDYATAPYLESFNWPAVFSFLRELSQAEGCHFPLTSFYVVVFRSRLFPDADGERLGLLDDHSHREAATSGRLLKY